MTRPTLLIARQFGTETDANACKALRRRCDLGGKIDGLAQATSSSMLLAAAARSGGPVIPQVQPALEEPGKLNVYYEADEVFNRPVQNWKLAPGTRGPLPPGLSLASDTGLISGTPTEAGHFAFWAICSDSYAPPQYSEQQLLAITIG